MDTRSAVRLIREEPVGLDDDAFGFGEYAQTLAAAARDSTQPLTIGVFGEWGTGKSSLMRMIVEHLAREERVVTVECNAWQFQHEEQPLFPLVAAVLRRFDDHRSKPDSLGRLADALQRAADEIEQGRSELPPASSVRAAPADMSDRLDKLLDRSQYAEAFELLRNVEVPEGWRFVVVVDDLDRCSPERAIRLLESIKLVLDQPGFVFVLGVSPRVIREHLEHRYREELGIKSFQGSEYLDKLVQLPFPIPSYREKIGGLTVKLADRLDDPDLEVLLPLLAEVFDYNPRALIRVINSLIIDRSINENLHASGHMPLVPLEMFAISRALQHRWESVHRLLELAGRDLAEDVAGWAADGVPEIPDDGPADDVSYVATAMHESPALTQLLHSPAGLAWLGDDEMRTAAAEFVEQHRRDPPETVDTGESYDAFISSARPDQEVAHRIQQGLIDRGFSAFLEDTSVTVGSSWVDTIDSALNSARAVVFLQGADTPGNSVQVQQITTVMDRTDKVVIPVVLPDGSASALPDAIRSVKPLSLGDTEPASVERVLDEIQRSLERRLKVTS